MNSFTFFSLCLVILVAHWNQVTCESEQFADEGEVKLRREDALELYNILKRALKKRQSNVSSSFNFDKGGLSGGNVDLSRRFGSNSQNSVTGNVNFDRNGYKSSSVGLSRTFGKNNQNRFGASVGHDRYGGFNAGIGVSIPFGRRTNF